ncbi:tetratricopeptide repeat protein [Algibacter amylolyticus]|uniref:Tetratricopeptide repeat protein n=1 Tax=Algibacter amylolyticus TaxID=1608400 RepID=A0A5M7B1V9_9FLAO|nr:tetratricopeptide repeat protein [Algibacter amylolyticus]KAA5823482.1 tetratricopeptide repeat protein [Algibacter amylolyticus]MBB5267632.1 tetratricopeptide (TPR) repeat protein [Algibacter amylolyticus]TSJ73970.1 tetratricopeptide repeat protein [Algibacter amylolyticus]
MKYFFIFFLYIFASGFYQIENVIANNKPITHSSEKEITHAYRDGTASQIEWYNSKGKIDSLKSYYKTGELNESFYFLKGKYHGKSYKHNKNGEILTIWTFNKGLFINREDPRIEFSAKTEIQTKELHESLKEVLSQFKTSQNNLKYRLKLESIRKKLGNYTLALSDLNKIETLVNNYALRKKIKTPKSILASIYERKGNIYSYLEMDEKALLFLEKALKEDPDNTRIMYNLSAHLLSTKSYNRAKLYLHKVITLKPTHSFANRSLSEYYIEHKDFKKAKYHNDIALTNEESLLKYSHPELENDLRTQRGLIFHKLGDNEAAIKILNEVIRLNKSNSYAYRNLGIIYYDLKNLTLAYDYLNKAKALGFIKKYDSNHIESLISASSKN